MPPLPPIDPSKVDDAADRILAAGEPQLVNLERHADTMPTDARLVMYGLAEIVRRYAAIKGPKPLSRIEDKGISSINSAGDIHS